MAILKVNLLSDESLDLFADSGIVVAPHVCRLRGGNGNDGQLVLLGQRTDCRQIAVGHVHVQTVSRAGCVHVQLDAVKACRGLLIPDTDCSRGHKPSRLRFKIRSTSSVWELAIL